jgi:glutamyl-tRNA synthetase
MRKNAPPCGRLAPSPTGRLHWGHALTFHTAWSRARAAGGQVRMRVEDLDPARCRPEFVDALWEDFAWLGLDWDGEPMFQSACRAVYLDAWRHLRDGGWIYPCARSRRDVQRAAGAPHDEEEAAEPLYPPTWRPPPGTGREAAHPAGVNWRFRVPDGEIIAFSDRRKGPCGYTAGVDFGDFVVWRRDDVPAYELAVVVDDLAQGVTEVVRGEDLLRSTARQILVYRALGGTPPAFYHGPLVRDAQGQRLAKRHDALSLARLRARGLSFAEARARWEAGGMAALTES